MSPTTYNSPGYRLSLFGWTLFVGLGSGWESWGADTWVGHCRVRLHRGPRLFYVLYRRVAA